MAEYSTATSQVDVAVLKDTLCAQQKLLTKLYNELDAEREASASAASESLAVILRLQGEKAAIKMEAEQYKRLAEEKMCHAEESLEIYEDLICEKEMELDALDNQVQEYRYKLLSLGYTDAGTIPENVSRKNETKDEHAGKQSIGIGRRNSAPIPLKYLFPVKDVADMESDSMSKIVEEHTGQDSGKKSDNSSTGDINSYWEQIHELDERVKEMTGKSYANLRSETRSPSSLSSQPSINNLNEQATFWNKSRSPSPQLSVESRKPITKNETDPRKPPLSVLRNEAANDNTASFPIVLDVFEVPRADEDVKASKEQVDDGKKTALHGNSAPEKAEVNHLEQPDCLKKVIKSAHHENGGGYKQSDIAAIDCHLAIVRPSTTVSETQLKLNELHMTSEIIEARRSRAGEDSNNRAEELRLLNEIRERISSLQDEIRSWKKMKACKAEEKEEDPSLVPIMEAMLHFWL